MITLVVMTKASETFLNALKRNPETVDEARGRQQRAWLADLATLRDQVRDWLAPVVAAKRATLAAIDLDVTDPDLGTYSAPALRISLAVSGTVDVTLRPRGMQVVGIVQTGGARFVGAQGRVDLEHGAIREILLRVLEDGETRWLSFGTGQKRVLDEEVFFELLARVGDVDIG